MLFTNTQEMLQGRVREKGLSAQEIKQTVEDCKRNALKKMGW